MPSRTRLACGAALGGVQQVGDLIGEDAVDLLRHGAVVAAQSGLDVHHRHALLDRHQGAGQSGINVADHQHAGRLVRIEHRLEAAHDLGGLHGVGARAHLEIDIRLRQLQIGEQPVVHVRVVMLAGMHQQRRHGRILAANARRMGAIFMKLGRAPTTQITGPRLAGQVAEIIPVPWVPVRFLIQRMMAH